MRSRWCIGLTSSQPGTSRQESTRYERYSDSCPSGASPRRRRAGGYDFPRDREGLGNTSAGRALPLGRVTRIQPVSPSTALVGRNTEPSNRTSNRGPRIDHSRWQARTKLIMDDLSSSGTSMSAPLVSGAAALIREWLIKDHGMTKPSAALVKALLLNNTAPMYN